MAKKVELDKRAADIIASLAPGKHMRYWHAHLQGLSPLLMHRPDPEAFAFEKKAKAEIKSPKEEAALSRYLSADGANLVLPSLALQRALVTVASNYKVKLFGGKKQALTTLIAGSLFIYPELLSLDLPATAYVVDARTVIIKATGGRILRGRARVDKWDAHAVLAYDTRDLGTGDEMGATLQQMLDEAGRRIGVLDFRPQRKGPFGRFEVVSFAEVEPRGGSE